MALYNGSEKFSSQIGIAQYADVTDLMKHMTVEVGDVGQVMLPLNENENKRRYLNGQAILQEQFPKFTAKLKNAVSLYPSMACTEAQWQAKRLADPDDQCAKFVIDDINGTIRLPRIKFLCGNLNLYKIAEGISNRRVIQKKLPTNSDRSWYVIYNDGYCEQGNNTKNIAEENHWFAFEIPFITTPHVIIGRERDSRNSVATNTDFMGRWDCSKTGFRTWGNWNGFRMSYTASGMIDLSLIKNYAKTEAENDYQFPYYIQVSTGVEYEVDVTRQITTNTPYSFGDSKYVDVDISNLSWLKSDGTWKDGTAYTDYYNWILTNANNSIAKFKLSTNAYTDYDWVVNTSERKFRLPLLNGSEVIPGNTSTNDINLIPIVTATGTKWIAPKNGYINGGCTGTAGSTFLEINNDTRKITGTASFNGGWGRTYTQVFAGDSVSFYYGGTNYAHKEILFRPAIGNGSLYYYVGETVQGANLINAGKLAESMAQLSALSTRYIVDKWENGSEYCYKYNDGWCVQGGKTDFMTWGTGGATQTITLHQEMKDTAYAVSGTMIDFTANWHTPGCYARAANTQQIQVGIASAVNTNQGTARCSWEVQGYMARG